MAYRKDVISYDAAHNFREWKLQAFPTQLNDTCAYYVHAELSRSGDTAMIIYSPVKRDIQGRTLLRVEKDEDGRDVEVWDNNLSTESYFIYLGTISASVDNDGATVERAWTDGFYTGTLDTDQQRMEEASGDWKTMFSLNSVTGFIDVLKTISSATINALTVTKEFIFGGKSLTGVAGTGDTLDKSKVNNATLPTTGYVQKEIEALDDHFLIKDDPDADQSVAGNVTFGRDVDVSRNQHIAGTQEVVGLQTLHEGFMTENFNDVGGQISGAQLTKDGVFTAAGLISMSFNVFELVYNKIRATGSKLALNATATIAGCRIVMKGGGELTPDEFYADDNNGVSNIDYALITFKEDETNGGLIPFENGDILYGYVNKIGESGQHARGGQCAMHIISSNEEIGNANAGGGYGKMTVRVQLYSDAITDEQGAADSAVGNMAPTEGMTLAHRGNTHNANRQASFFIDSQTGNIVMLDGVNSPAIGLENYAVVLGKCPSALYTIVKDVFTALKQTDPVVYARYAIFENFIQLDHQMNPIQRENNRGEWSAPVTDINGNQINPYTNDVSYYDVVTYQGSLYKCLKTGTTQAPSEDSDWLLLVAKGEDGLTPKPNLLRYSNFDKYDDDIIDDGYHPIVGWTGKNDNSYIYDGNVIPDDYDGSNSFYMNLATYGRKAQTVQTIQFKAGITYTLSCAVKSKDIITDNNLAHGFILVIPRDNVIVIKEDVDDYGTNGYRSTFEIRFCPRDAWKEQYITFTVYNDCEAKLRIYSWATKGQIYISKLKLEESSIVTPYVRHIEDSNGKNGKNGEDGKDGEPYTFPNLFEDPTFENVNEEDKILTDWGESSFSKLGFIVENAYEGYNAIGIMFSSYMMKQDCVLSPKAYTVSLMVKQETNHVAFFGVKSSVAVDIEPMSTTQNQLDSVATADYDKRYKIYTQKTDNYEYVTFKVTPSEEANVTFVFGNASGSYSCYFCRPQLEEGDKATKFSLPMSSLAGPAGKAGPALYAAGEWDKNTEYVRDSLKVPYVYYQPSGASKGTYYVLKAESAKGASQAPTTSNGNDYWEPITNLKYLFTEFLMSNQARFGSENGGVFYDNMLFSAKYEDGTYYSGTIDESKMPKLLLDFRDGFMYAQEVQIKGHIEAKTGTFAGELKAATGNIENVNAKNLTVESGEFTGTIKAEAGEIGGFEIKSDSIGAIATSNLGKEQASFSQKVIRFFKGVFGGTKQVSVGTNTIQEATDVPSLIRVDNTERNDTGINYGISVDVDNGGHNFALHAKHGSITSQGWVGSSGVSRITTPNESIYLENQMGAGNPFLWILKSERLNGTAFYLPHSSNLFKAMGVGVVPEVCSVKMTFICSDGSNAIRIVGKQANDDTLPKIIDKSGNQISFIELTAGNSATLLLDFIKTTNASSVTYNARAFIL